MNLCAPHYLQKQTQHCSGLNQRSFSFLKVHSVEARHRSGLHPQILKQQQMVHIPALSVDSMYTTGRPTEAFSPGRW